MICWDSPWPVQLSRNVSIIILIKWVAWSLLENINYVAQYLSSCFPRSRFPLSLLELYDSFYCLYSLHLHLNWCSLHPAMLNPAWSELLPRKSSFLRHQPTDHSVLLTDREQSEQWVQHWYENSSATSQSKQELLFFIVAMMYQRHTEDDSSTGRENWRLYKTLYPNQMRCGYKRQKI